MSSFAQLSSEKDPAVCVHDADPCESDTGFDAMDRQRSLRGVTIIAIALVQLATLAGCAITINHADVFAEPGAHAPAASARRLEARVPLQPVPVARLPSAPEKQPQRHPQMN